MTTTPATVDVVIVGAGFGGLYAAHRCLELGYAVSVFEAGDGDVNPKGRMDRVIWEGNHV